MLLEKADEVVAHFKYTVLMTNSSTIKTTGIPLKTENIKSQNVIADEGILKLLKTSMNKNAQKTMKKK